MARVPLRRAGAASCRSAPGGRRSFACVSPQWLGPSLGRDLRTRGARRCYIGASTSWAAKVPHHVCMEGPGFDDPGPPIPTPVSRVRQGLTVAVVLTLVVAMVVLAFVSGRGVITPPPPAPPAA